MPDTTDPIRAACQNIADGFAFALFPPHRHGPEMDSARAAVSADMLKEVEPIVRRALTDRERAAVEAGRDLVRIADVVARRDRRTVLLPAEAFDDLRAALALYPTP